MHKSSNKLAALPVSPRGRGLDAQLQEEKLRLAIRLAGGVAHELNNPLCYVLSSYAEMRDCVAQIETLCTIVGSVVAYLEAVECSQGQQLAQQLRNACQHQHGPLPQELAHATEIGTLGVERLTALLGGLRYLSQQANSTQDFRRVDLSHYLHGLASDQVKIHHNGPLWAKVRGNEFCSALHNLVTYLLHPGATNTSEAGQHQVDVTAQIVANRIVIRAINPALVLTGEECNQLFDPRFVVDHAGGTGLRLDLGLALAYKTLRENRANIAVASREKHGTEFSISIDNCNTTEV